MRHHRSTTFDKRMTARWGCGRRSDSSLVQPIDFPSASGRSELHAPVVVPGEGARGTPSLRWHPIRNCQRPRVQAAPDKTQMQSAMHKRAR